MSKHPLPKSIVVTGASSGLGAGLARDYAAPGVRLDERGQPSQSLRLPLSHPSSLCFGGPGLDTLFVTSIADSGRLRADGELDGRVLHVRGLGRRGAVRPQCRIERPGL